LKTFPALPLETIAQSHLKNKDIFSRLYSLWSLNMKGTITQFNTDQNPNWKGSFFIIWTGQAVSLLGSQLVQFALIWYLTDTTSSATILATASLVAFLPNVVLSPFIGALVDRWNRRKIMLIADTFIALVTVGLAVLFALGIAEIWHIYTLMFLRSIGGSFHGPAMIASTSLMVPKEQLTRIQGLNQTLNGGLNIISAPLGALLIEIMPTQGILAIDVVTALIAIVPLLFISIPQPERDPTDLAKKPSVLREMREGMEYMISWRGIMIIAIFAALLNFLLSPAFSLLPLLVKDHFNGGATQLGWINAIFGIGVILGGLTLGIWGGFKKRVYTSLIGVFGIGLGSLLLGLVPSNYFIIATLGMAITGISQPIANGALGAIMQATVAPEYQGRVFTLLGSVAMGMTPIGLAIAGPLSDWLGIQTWFLFGGIACIVMGLLMLTIPAVVNVEGGRSPTDDPPAGLEASPPQT
jgi:DHA3 family macrolide efflux protein-like MFS transporter